MVLFAWCNKGSGLKKGSLQFQVIMAIAIGAICIALLTASYAIYTIRDYLNDEARGNVIVRYQGMTQLIDIYKENAQSHAATLSKHPQIIEAAKRRDTNALFSITTPLMKDSQLDYMVITDPKGFVIIRTHEPGVIPKANDSIANQVNVAQAMAGKSFVGIEEGKVVKLSVRAGAPIYDETGRLVGILSTGYVISQNSIVDKAKKTFGAEFNLYLQDELVASTFGAEQGKRAVGTRVEDASIIQKVLNEGNPYVLTSEIEGKNYTIAFGPLVGASGKVTGMIATATPSTLAENISRTLTQRITGVSVIIIVVAVGIAVFFCRRVLRQLQAVLDKMLEVAAGNLSGQQLTIRRQDEIGQLANGCNTMINNLRRLIDQVSQAASQVAASSEQLMASAEQSAQVTMQVAATITDVAQGAEKQAGTVDTTTAIVEQMSAGMEQVAANANAVSGMADKTAGTALQGDKAVDAAINQMRNIELSVSSSAQVVAKLGERSKEIGQIVSAISEIAGQTNLLALNAAIEAARAGEQGRGFAVVAEEVRKLAEQSQAAAKQIANLISEIQTETDNAVWAMDNGTREVKVGAEVVNTAGQAFKGIVTQIGEVSSQIKEISAAIQQMATGSRQVVTAVRDIDCISKDTALHTQSVSAATEEQSASMEEIAASSQALARMADELQSAVKKFKV